MKKGLIVFFVAVLFSPIVSQAQQSPLYTQYMLNDYVINPAVAGSKGFVWIDCVKMCPRTIPVGVIRANIINAIKPD